MIKNENIISLVDEIHNTIPNNTNTNTIRNVSKHRRQRTINLKEKLRKKKKDLQAQYHRGIEVTEQMRAEKLRKKINKVVNLKPGARRAMHEGLMARKSPVDVMKEEYSRRKYERKQKYKSK